MMVVGCAITVRDYIQPLKLSGVNNKRKVYQQIEGNSEGATQNKIISGFIDLNYEG